MSSANNFAFDEMPLARSFIYIKNRSGPSMEPWGTPSLTSDQEEVCPLRNTLCFLFLKIFDNRFKSFPDIPFCFSLKLRPSCHTLLGLREIHYGHQNLHQTIGKFCE